MLHLALAALLTSRGLSDRAHWATGGNSPLSSQVHKAAPLRGSIWLVSAPTSHGPDKAVPSFPFYRFGTFLVTPVPASVHTHTPARAVQGLPRVPITPFCLLLLLQSDTGFVPPPQLAFSEDLPFFLHIFAKQNDVRDVYNVLEKTYLCVLWFYFIICVVQIFHTLTINFEDKCIKVSPKICRYVSFFS